jgi:molybdopterin molybdotransferase
MAEFFRVKTRQQVLSHLERLEPLGEEQVGLEDCLGRILSRGVTAQEDLPAFVRSTVDGYAIRARDTFGAGESTPSLFTIKGEVLVGRLPQMKVSAGEAVWIPTGGALPEGADAVVMMEHTERIDPQTLEVYRSVAPGENTIRIGEDFRRGQEALPKGWAIRPQDVGLLAALGVDRPWVFKRPRVAVLSTGDEVVEPSEMPPLGMVRDVNGPALLAMIQKEGAIPLWCGIARDESADLRGICERALAEADCLCISGGSSVGTRDYMFEVLENWKGVDILVHGMAIRPGKPTMLAMMGKKPILGLPGHPASALMVFHLIGRPMLDALSGRKYPHRPPPLRARVTRNLASAQGREDFFRVRLMIKDGELWADPVLGASGLIRTWVMADGLMRIDAELEGINSGEWVEVELFQ